MSITSKTREQVASDIAMADIDRLPRASTDAIQVAVIVEREACAMTALEFIPDSASASEDEIKAGIAAAIRARRQG